MYSKDIFRYAYSIVKNKEDAKDLTQDIFNEFIQKRDLYNGKCSLKTWFLVLTRNRCYNFLKARNLRQTVSLEEVENYESTNDIETKMSLELALQKLNVEENEIIFLREYLGYSYKEIAEILEITIDNVKVKIHRAKKKLKKELYG